MLRNLVIVQKFTLKDCHQVMSIERQVFNECDSQFFLRVTEAFPEGFYVAKTGDIVFGYIIFMLDQKMIGKVISIAVKPEYRKQGIATLLLEKTSIELRREGARSLLLEVRVSNVAAQLLYMKLGFEYHGYLKEYYRDGEDAYTMLKTLTPFN